MRKLVILSAFLALGTFLSAQTYKVNTEKSSVKWVGKKIGKQHDGTVGLKEGHFEIKDDKFVSGSFIIDMDVMTDESSDDPKKPSNLVKHLKNDDFFSVDKYPVAKLEITGSDKFVDGKSKVSGLLTIKDKTHPISFVVTRKGATFTSSMEFDRTLYDIKYGSGKFFQDIGDKAIKDEIGIDVTLIAERQP